MLKPVPLYRPARYYICRKSKEMEKIIERIVQQDVWHAKWLNTLSFMENCGARKISAGEDPVETTLLQLKHAAEEHRHAFYLKKQIAKLTVTGMENYHQETMLGGFYSRHYLPRLDVFTARYLKATLPLSPKELRFAAYLLVTYAIEVRADTLYPIYQRVLSNSESPVVVKSIILEEEGHLEEMTTQLAAFSADWQLHAEQLLAFENLLFKEWINQIKKEVHAVD